MIAFFYGKYSIPARPYYPPGPCDGGTAEAHIRCTAKELKSQAFAAVQVFAADRLKFR